MGGAAEGDDDHHWKENEVEGVAWRWAIVRQCCKVVGAPPRPQAVD
jgi:hypothetical protein